MKKKLTISLSIVTLLLLGGWYAKHLIVNKVGTAITQVITSPEVQKEINQLPASQIDHMISASLKTKPNGQNATNISPSTAAKPQPSRAETNNNVNTPVTNNSSMQSTPSKKETESSPVATNREEAIQFAMSRFSTQEIMHYMTVYQNRKGLTPSQKKAIKAEILSRFTPAEIRELAVAAKK